MVRVKRTLERSIEGAGYRVAAVMIERVLVHHEAKPWSQERRDAAVDELAPLPADLLEEATVEIVRGQVFDPKPADWWTRSASALAERKGALARVTAALDRWRRHPGGYVAPSPQQRERGLEALAGIRKRLLGGDPPEPSAMGPQSPGASADGS